MTRKNVPGVIVVLILLCSPALLATVHGREIVKSIATHRDAKISGQTLPKGSYDVRFSDDRDGVVVLLQGKREILKAPCKVASMVKPAAATQVVMARASDGSYRVIRIELEGVYVALLFE